MASCHPHRDSETPSSVNTLVLNLESWVTHHTSQEQALPGQCLASNILSIIQGEKKTSPQRNQITIYIQSLSNYKQK